MDSPRRIVVLDDDAKVRQLVEAAFRPPDYEVYAFADGRDALMKLHDIRPHLILSDVWMPEVDGRLFLQVVKRSPTLKDVPFVFLTAVRTEGAAQAALRAGADSFLMKPFPLALLREKVRALLGLTEEAGDGGGSQAPAPGAASIEARSAGSPPPHHAVVAPAASHSGPPPVAQRESRRLMAPRAAAAKYVPAQLEGRFTMASVGGHRVPVLTEADNRPQFTVTTLMTCNGNPVRKIETSWQHPLERREDLILAQRLIRLQHEHALALLEQLGLARAPRRVLWDSNSRLVDGTVLCSALVAVFEQARVRVGPQTALALARRTFEGLSRSLDAVRAFRVTDNGNVVLNGNNRPLVPQAAVAAAAEWAVRCCAASAGGSGESAAMDIRRATSSMEPLLERIGFYAAVVAAARRKDHSPSAA